MPPTDHLHPIAKIVETVTATMVVAECFDLFLELAIEKNHYFLSFFFFLSFLCLSLPPSSVTHTLREREESNTQTYVIIFFCLRYICLLVSRWQMMLKALS